MVEREKRPVDPELVYKRTVEVISRKTLTNRNGVTLPMDVASVCVHGDGNALEVLAAARRAIADRGLRVSCATRPGAGWPRPCQRS